MPHRLKRDRARASSRHFDRSVFPVISTDRREWRNLSRTMLRTLRRTGRISPLRGPVARSGRYDGRALRLRYPDTPRLELARPPPYLPRRRLCLRTGPSPRGLPARFTGPDYRRGGCGQGQERAAAERCRSGRTGRSRKPLCALRTVGSNPTLSATLSIKKPFIQQVIEFQRISHPQTNPHSAPMPARPDRRPPAWAADPAARPHCRLVMPALDAIEGAPA